MQEQEAEARERRRKVSVGPYNHVEERDDPQRVAE